MSKSYSGRSNISRDENVATLSFLRYIISASNKPYLLITAVVTVIYFIVLRKLFPVPSFYADSFTWVGAANTNQPVTFRPIGYSKFIQFAKFLSSTDVALIALQYLCNVAANLFLFFTVCWFFGLRKFYKWLLFALLILNPFYLFYSNYVSSDAVFCCFTVFWFTLLIWIMHKPTWLNMLLQILVLAALFELRYNAVIYPVVTTIAVAFSRQEFRRKVVALAITFLMIATLIFVTAKANESYIRVRIFSGFSGWQMANNAMNVLRYVKMDTAAIKDKQVRDVVKYATPFFDTAKFIPPDATSWYMWDDYSPLKKYIKVYAPKSVYFITWNRLAPLYSKFGEYIILKNPGTYLKHFVAPNFKNYIFPPLEIYETYMENRDTMPAVVTKYFHYRSNKTPAHHPFVYAVVFKPFKFIFTVVNVAFIILLIIYYAGKHYTKDALLNKTILCFIALYFINLFFVVLLAPSVFRYHVFILTLAFAVILCVLQSLSISKKLQSA